MEEHMDSNEAMVKKKTIAKESKKSTIELDSDEERAIEIIKTNFSCAICLSLTKEPCMTPCGHLFCSDCLMQWTQSTEDSNCPKCRRVFNIEELVSISNGFSIKQKKFGSFSKKRILKPGISAQNMKFGNIIIYQEESKRPAFKGIMVAILAFLILALMFKKYMDI